MENDNTKEQKSQKKDEQLKELFQGVTDCNIDIEDDIKQVVNNTLDNLLKKMMIMTTDMWHKALEEPHGIEAVILYLHYYFTAKTQKTNQVWALRSYCMNGLKWGNERFKRAKALLKKWDWIEDISKRDEKGQYKQHYVRLKYIWKSDKLKSLIQVINIDSSSGTKTHPVDTSTGGYQNTNALSSKEEILKVNNNKEVAVNPDFLKNIRSKLDFLKIDISDKKLKSLINKHHEALDEVLEEFDRVDQEKDIYDKTRYFYGMLSKWDP